ncbi:MAG: hypothetical protein IJH79_14525, partial [Lentisphaeria bacterium]|nr:hypothetical protein [Lentisphaeria bacterium]
MPLSASVSIALCGFAADCEFFPQQVLERQLISDFQPALADQISGLKRRPGNQESAYFPASHC